jgi:hypothetical protein
MDQWVDCCEFHNLGVQQRYSDVYWENIHGVKVTPNVYTSLKDLDKLASALKKMAI